MKHCYFDLHAGGLSEWDDDGQNVKTVDEAVVIARNMLGIVISHIDRLQGDRHAVVVIRDRTGNQVVTVTRSVVSGTRIDRSETGEA